MSTEESKAAEQSPSDLRIGSLVGNFLIRAELGRGGMGTVYLAEDARLRRNVALKILPAALVDETRRRRFLREARTAARISHPNVTAVFEVGQDAGDTYIAMEYIEGRTLRALLSAHGGALPISEALRITAAITAGLESAHTAGIIHRDLKPENVMLAHSGIVKLLDFGLAKVMAPVEEDAALWRDESNHQLTAEGRVAGTPRYMSPEQVLDRPLDLRSDLFSLGVILFEMATGCRPFQGRTTMEVFMSIGRDDPPLPSRLNSKVSPELDRLLLRCLAKRPEDRFGSARELLTAVEKLLAGQGASIALASAELNSASDHQGGGRLERTLSSSGDGEIDPPLPLSSGLLEFITGDERRLIPMVLLDLGPEGGDPQRATMAEALRHEVERRGGQAVLLPEGLLVATFTARLTPTDQAAQSARSALALRRIAKTLPIALAMGRVEGTIKPGPAELVSRAKQMLAWTADSGTGSASGMIAIDEMTAGLLSAHFDVKSGEQGPLLAGELQIPHVARTLLGRLTPCVGRERELAALTVLFDECVEEPLGRAVLVVAPPGVGKTRLAQEMMRVLSRQRGPELSIWMSAGASQGAGSALNLLRHLLRAECAICGDESLAEQRGKVEKRVAQSVAQRDRGRVTEFLGEFMGTPFPDDKSAPLRAARQDAELMNDQMRQAFVDFIAAETARKPLLIVLDDLHWGDLPTVRFIDAALRAHSDKPWMVLALARPEVHDRFPKLWATRGLRQIHLKELSRKAAEQLVREILGSAASHALVERMVRLSDGHAFYLEELIRAAALGLERTLPDTVVAMVQARLMDLDANARRLLRAGSVFGEVFWQSAVGGIADGTTADILASLVEQEILIRRLDSKFPGEREYAFRHALLREGAYSLLTNADLVLGHRLAAEWLELHDEQNPLVLAEHFECGERPLLAAGYYRGAVAQAYYAGDLEAAISYGERGLSCGATGIVREHLLGMLCDAYAQRWNLGRATQIAQVLMSSAQPGGMAYVQAAKIRSVVALHSGKFSECIEVVDAAMEVAPEKGAVGVLAQMLMTCALILPLIGQRERGEAYLHKLSALCEDADNESIIAQGWMHFTLAFAHLGLHEDPWSALREAEASCAFFTESGYRKGFANAQILVGMSAWFLGMANRAERELLDPRASDQDLPEMAAHRASVLVDLLLARGDVEGARRFASETVELRHAQQNRSEEGHGRHALARVFHAAGDLNAAEREAVLASELQVLPVYRQWSLSLLAAIRGSQGRTAEAQSLAVQAVRTCESLRNFSYRGPEVRLILADALEGSGDGEAARQSIRNAAARILSTASRIDDLEIQQSFLCNVPANARILDRAHTWNLI